jgi:peptidoglycan hydrolase-like protein with peptidoglycan-binding domain
MAKVTYDILRGAIGSDVVRLQEMLNQNEGAGLVVDGVYGGGTFNAIKALEAKHRLPVTGQCAGATLAKVRELGFRAVEFEVGGANSGAAFPPKPPAGTLPQPNAAITTSLFGSFRFERRPVPGNNEAIRILDGWDTANIVTVTIPQLVGVPIPLDAGRAVLSKGKLQCHKKARDKLVALFQAWEDAGLKDRILTFDGSFVPRLIRGTTNPVPANLSNHSFGSTFDINAEQNPRGSPPALMGKRGCVRELVDVANRLGFYWGGHFAGKADGMHFEAAKL